MLQVPLLYINIVADDESYGQRHPGSRASRSLGSHCLAVITSHVFDIYHNWIWWRVVRSSTDITKTPHFLLLRRMNEWSRRTRWHEMYERMWLTAQVFRLARAGYRIVVTAPNQQTSMTPRVYYNFSLSSDAIDVIRSSFGGLVTPHSFNSFAMTTHK
jgi:hypothetical protein